jgi:hypothetical protein
MQGSSKRKDKFLEPPLSNVLQTTKNPRKNLYFYFLRATDYYTNVCPRATKMSIIRKIEQLTKKIRYTPGIPFFSKLNVVYEYVNKNLG